MINVINDLEQLTGIKTSILNKIISCLEYTIIDNAIEETYNDNELLQYNLGLGILSIEVIDDSLHYSFKPSKSFEDELINAINNKTNILELKLAESIDTHIYKTYKDML